METGQENLLRALTVTLSVVAAVTCVVLAGRATRSRQRRELLALRLERDFLRAAIDRAERMLAKGEWIPRAEDTSGERQHRAITILRNAQSMSVDGVSRKGDPS